jgi:hypothetical protein
MKQTGMIRIVLGLLMALGAVGGMEQQPDADLLVQSLVALAGIALMLWAVRDINRQADSTIDNLKR